MGTTGEKAAIAAAVEGARRRLVGVNGRRTLQRRWWLPVTAGALAAATRPILWPVASDRGLLVALAAAFGLFLAAAVGAAALLVALGRRSGPTLLGAARATDEALGLREVVASGLAFESERLGAPMAALARRRAAAAVRDLAPKSLFPNPPLRLAARRWLAAAPACAAALLIGTYRPGIVEALLAPPTDRELASAAQLEAAARRAAPPGEEAERTGDLETPRDREGRPSKRQADGRDRAIRDLAKAAARAARRGNREETLARLDELRRLALGQQTEAEALAEALRRVGRALGTDLHRGSPSAERPEGLGEALRAMADSLRSGSSGDEAEARRLAASLDAAATAAEAQAGGASTETRRLAEALRRAAEALRRADREAATRALEAAEARSEAMARAHRAAAGRTESVAQLLAAASALERAVGSALGRQNGHAGERQGEGSMASKAAGRGEGRRGEGEARDALTRALARRLAALGGRDPSGRPGPGIGGHLPDRGDAHRDRLAAKGSLRASSAVREGKRAVQAIRGLGRGEEPGEPYGDVFPGYAAVAEESVQDETVPAARREAVRIYFEAIRPGRLEDDAGDGERGGR